MTLPPPEDPTPVPPAHRPIATVAVFGGGVSLMLVIVALGFLGFTDKEDAQIASTGLATIGATLAGAFAGWMGGQGMGGSNRRQGDPPPPT